MTLDALALPLLVLTAVGVALTALQVARAPGEHPRGDWWLTLALVVAATGLTAALDWMWSGVVGFGLYLLLVIAPLQLAHRIGRAVQAGDERRALRLARLAAYLHPSRPNRELLATLPTILSLRAGEEVPAEALDRAAMGNPATRASYDVVLLHNRRDVDAVRAAFADPEARAELLAQGFGTIYVQAVGCTDAGGDALAEAIGVALRGDPFLQQPDRAARLVIMAHALAGEVAATQALTRTLAVYLEREEAALCHALALWCAGEAARAREVLAAATARVPAHRCARSMLASLDAMIARRGPRPRTAPTGALAMRLSALRGQVAALAELATFVGRQAIRPRVTQAICAVLVAVYVAYAWTGDPFDGEHAYAWGALKTDSFGWSESWRLWALTLLHGGGLHLAFNVLALSRFGGFVEILFGRARLAAIYLLGAALSGLSVALLRDPSEPLILLGASGAIMALGGAELALLLKRRTLRATRIGRAQLTVLVVLFSLQVVFDQITPHVSGTAHAAGMLAGMLLGALLMPPAPGARELAANVTVAPK